MKRDNTPGTSPPPSAEALVFSTPCLNFSFACSVPDGMAMEDKCLIRLFRVGSDKVAKLDFQF